MKPTTLWMRSLGLAALAAVLAAAGCSKDPAKSGKPVVVTGIFAYYDAAREIGGDKIEAVNLLPPGRSPHDYDPTMADKRKAVDAKLVLLNGLELDNWVRDLAKDNKSATTLVVSANIKIHQASEVELGDAHKDEHKDEAKADHKDEHKGHDHAHSHEGDPHIWLNPLNQIQAAQKIRDALIKLDPASKETFEKNAERYIAQLKTLDAQFESAAKAFSKRQFIGLHTAYTYLAERYGLEQVLAIHDQPEQEPAPAKLNAVVDTMKARGISVVFVENALPSKSAERILERTGAKKLILQPLESYDKPEDSYLKLMTQNLENLREGLK